MQLKHVFLLYRTNHLKQEHTWTYRSSKNKKTEDSIMSMVFIREFSVPRKGSNKRPPEVIQLRHAKRYHAYWRAALERGTGLFQSERNYSHEISELCNFLFPNNNNNYHYYDI